MNISKTLVLIVIRLSLTRIICKVFALTQINKETCWNQFYFLSPVAALDEEYHCLNVPFNKELIYCFKCSNMYPSFFAISPDVYLNLWNLYEAQINSLICVSKPTLLTSKIKFSSKIFGAHLLSQASWHWR